MQTTNSETTDNPQYMSEPIIKKTFSAKERWLLLVAFALGLLFDRLLLSDAIFGYGTGQAAGVFWLCWVVLFYAFCWKRLRHKWELWYIAACCSALCIWKLIFTGGNHEYSMITNFIIPASLMAHAQWAAGEHTIRNPGKIALSWLFGWVVKPFSAIMNCIGAGGSLIAGENRSSARKALIGAGVAALLLCIVLPLLAGADQVFGFFIGKILGGFGPGRFIFHTILTLLGLVIFYSLLWNNEFSKSEAKSTKKKIEIDVIISCIVLGVICMVYILFCAVAFTYLFARNGLPEGMLQEHSRYVREGFYQTVVVCTINLIIFAVFLQFSGKSKAVTTLLGALLALTVVMLFSGVVRLKLYIDVYGLTWLRLISAWFIVWMAVTIIISAVKMARERIPAAVICAMVLLGWYLVLGFANPDGLIKKYNDNNDFVGKTIAETIDRMPVAARHIDDYSDVHGNCDCGKSPII